MAERRASKRRSVSQTRSRGRRSKVVSRSIPGGFDASHPPHIELVFGFVGPTGIDLNKVCEALRSQLKVVQYETIEIRLSELISKFLGKSDRFANEYVRIKALMDWGTGLREKTQADIVARLAIAAIRESRTQKTGNVFKPASRVAYLIRSFKRPEEVELFRQVYGKAFTLLSVYAPRDSRTQFLRKVIGPSLGQDKSHTDKYALELITRDNDEEGRPLGQKVGKTFPLADYFVTADSRHELERHSRRLVQLTFGNPYISPSRDEQAMFFAKAAALRSLDLSRQVGAAIVSQDGDIISTGCNEVPKFGGGLYWGEDEKRDRDFERGTDSNVDIKCEIVEDTFDRLRRRKLLIRSAKLRSSGELANAALFGNDAYLRDARLFDIIEFGRAVHAEMAAISQAARIGTKLEGTRLFCTTFPCHICARHIVASGIREVIFVEPYEKSRTAELYRDSISIEPPEPSSNKANFRAFVGVAPRRYMDFFESHATRKTDDGKIKNLDEIAATPRLRRLVLTYTMTESFVVRDTPARPARRKV